MMSFFTGIALVGIFLGVQHLIGNDELDTLNRRHAAADKFYEWKGKNPGVYIGLSPEGSRLLLEFIEACDRLAEACYWMEDRENRDHLMNLLHDLPPQTPTEANVPVEQQKSDPRGRSLSLYNVDYLLHNGCVVEVNFSLRSELNCSWNKSKESMVFTHAYVLAWKNVSSSLADDDRASLSCISFGNFNPKVLWIGVSTVFGCSRGLLMCHFSLL